VPDLIWDTMTQIMASGVRAGHSAQASCMWGGGPRGLRDPESSLETCHHVWHYPSSVPRIEGCMCIAVAHGETPRHAVRCGFNAVASRAPWASENMLIFVLYTKRAAVVFSCAHLTSRSFRRTPPRTWDDTCMHHACTQCSIGMELSSNSHDASIPS
jgi:hypothetical protein